MAEAVEINGTDGARGLVKSLHDSVRWDGAPSADSHGVPALVAVCNKAFYSGAQDPTLFGNPAGTMTLVGRICAGTLRTDHPDETREAVVRRLRAGADWIEVLEEVPQRGTNRTSRGRAASLPSDPITTKVACQRYEVSRSTLKRLVRNGDFPDYRPHGAKRNAELILSEADIAGRYTKRSSL